MLTSNVGFTVPVATRTLPGLRGLGITDARVTRILSGNAFGLGQESEADQVAREIRQQSVADEMARGERRNLVRNGFLVGGAALAGGVGGAIGGKKIGTGAGIAIGLASGAVGGIVGRYLGNLILPE